jgi:multimeric flavodoxin WrbA
MTTPIVILGSSRSFGNTRKAVERIIEANQDIPVIDLRSLNITPYDYTHRNKNDDCLPLMEQVLSHSLLILATPIYWYTMSAHMKLFIDRLSDFLTIRKDIGRKLRGTNLFVIASFETSLPKNFEDPFSHTCEYLGINYQGCSYIYFGKNNGLLSRNTAEINKAQSALLELGS